jgi:hypothetical protein
MSEFIDRFGFLWFRSLCKNPKYDYDKIYRLIKQYIKIEDIKVFYFKTKTTVSAATEFVVFTEDKILEISFENKDPKLFNKTDIEYCLCIDYVEPDTDVEPIYKIVIKFYKFIESEKSYEIILDNRKDVPEKEKFNHCLYYKIEEIYNIFKKDR